MNAICRLSALVLFLPSMIAMAAERYPSRPVRMIVPTSPGGANDVVARLVANQMSETLGQQVIVDNRGGAGGAIGAEIAARAVADGYTLLAATFATHTVIPHMQKDVRYDALGDFTPIALFVVQFSMLSAHPSFPARTVKELIVLARAKPGTINYASAGPGSTSDIAGLMFAKLAGIDITIVPYKGGGPAVAAVVANEAQLNFGPVPASAAHIRAGRLRGIAVSGTTRSLSAPDVPTVEESGLLGFSQSSWVGLVAPSRTPTAIVDRLYTVVDEALRSAELREQLVRTGAEPARRSRAAFGVFIREEYKRYGAIVKDLLPGVR